METFVFTPVAYVRSPYASEKDVPKGLGARQTATGRIEVLPEYADGLTDIDGFSHLYILWVFHRVLEPRGLGARTRTRRPSRVLEPRGLGARTRTRSQVDRVSGFALVSTPPCDDRPHGIFASRAPSRPNPIGLSVVRLLGRAGPVLDVRGIDMVDGSPVLDIKPYLSNIPENELRRGWLAEAEERKKASSGAVL